MEQIKQQILRDGFAIMDSVYSDEEVTSILEAIDQVEVDNPNFRRSAGLFAIRQFLKEVPMVGKLVFNDKLILIINNIFGEDYFITKSIYFDKPKESNWFVAYHQDLTVSVDKKIDIEGYGPWTTKQDQFAVQPPLEILQNNFTLRIHLDDTDENNGALKVLTSSHLKDICRIEAFDRSKESEVFCKVKKGGIMVMKPLLFHASERTINNKKRRVIHIEFSNATLDNGLKWSEKQEIIKI